MSAKIIFLITLSTILLTACAQDPWKADQIRAEAEAYATRTAADQQAMTDQQERTQDQTAHEILMEQERLRLEREKAIEAERRAAWIRFYFWTSMVGVACAIFALLLMTRSTVHGFQVVAEATAKAIAQRADIRSRLIPLDPKTGMYPMLVEYLGNGDRLVTDLNTSQTWHLDRVNQPTPQQVAGSIAIKHTYILSKHASETRKGGDASGVSIIQPPIISEHGIGARDIIDLVNRWRQEDGDDT